MWSFFGGLVTLLSRRLRAIELYEAQLAAVDAALNEYDEAGCGTRVQRIHRLGRHCKKRRHVTLAPWRENGTER